MFPYDGERICKIPYPFPSQEPIRRKKEAKTSPSGVQKCHLPNNVFWPYVPYVLVERTSDFTEKSVTCLQMGQKEFNKALQHESRA
ncbi:hypothetical protein OUZ56_021848 [Daphnia magna]|uniref:Uncharacterized protein n=1 Tax=Daphnia magna TaxID=35525 RepID=A0ABR0AUR1_9CRUS|nr:hypothetical protein OUZ56_021848 [Daphnia magna]